MCTYCGRACSTLADVSYAIICQFVFSVILAHKKPITIKKMYSKLYVLLSQIQFCGNSGCFIGEVYSKCHVRFDWIRLSVFFVLLLIICI